MLEGSSGGGAERGEAVRHVPVLVEETLGFLEPGGGGLFVDCTVGPGGHAEALLRAHSRARLLGIDRDPEALGLATERLRRFGDRVRLLRGDYRHLTELLGEEGVNRATGIFADLGVSSLQLETAARGFSFQRDGPLDMRMGGGDLTAREVINKYSEGDLERIFRSYGEEKRARRMARAVVERRQQGPIETTSELRGLAAGVGGGRRAGRRIDPATRVFQALRIEVNRELAGLERLMDQVVDLLEREGRLVIISYHSLEDRIVKHSLRAAARGEVDQITGRPRAETRLIEVLTRKPVRPSETELARNPRARSARLRAARRL